MTRVLLVACGSSPLCRRSTPAPFWSRRSRDGGARLSAMSFARTDIFATAYAAVDRDLPRLLGRDFDVVLMFGVAEKRRHLCVETRARNAVSVLYPDVCALRPQHGAIVLGAPSALRASALPVSLLAAARAGGFPARLSRERGPLFMQLRVLANAGSDAELQERKHTLRVQFVHIPRVRLLWIAPPAAQRADRPSLSRAACSGREAPGSRCRSPQVAVNSTVE